MLLTNDKTATHGALATRCAQRMLIENVLSDAARFFPMDALSFAVGLEVDFELGRPPSLPPGIDGTPGREPPGPRCAPTGGPGVVGVPERSEFPVA